MDEQTKQTNEQASTASSTAEEKMRKALNRLAKWRSVFAGWQLGTRPMGDAECDAVRDHRSLTLILRAEANALITLLIDKGVITNDEYSAVLEKEANLLSAELEKVFPGFKATDLGMHITTEIAKETTKNWPK